MLVDVLVRFNYKLSRERRAEICTKLPKELLNVVNEQPNREANPIKTLVEFNEPEFFYHIGCLDELAFEHLSQDLIILAVSNYIKFLEEPIDHDLPEELNQRLNEIFFTQECLGNMEFVDWQWSTRAHHKDNIEEGSIKLISKYLSWVNEI